MKQGIYCSKPVIPQPHIKQCDILQLRLLPFNYADNLSQSFYHYSIFLVGKAYHTDIVVHLYAFIPLYYWCH